VNVKKIRLQKQTAFSHLIQNIESTQWYEHSWNRK